DFEPQEKRILSVVKDAGVPIFAKHGFEADDLIATMGKTLVDQDFDVFVVSKDKDIRQLLGPHLFMYDVQGNEVIDEKRVLEKCGYRPAQAVEVQTLMGDAIDNVPGIPGVGEKTAAKLVTKYGSADEVMKHLDDLTPKLRENFERHGKDIPLSRRLVTLKNDVEFDFDPEACRYLGLDADAVRKHLKELDFRSLSERFETWNGQQGATRKSQSPPRAPVQEHLFAEPVAPAGPGAQTSSDCEYVLVNTPGAFDKFVDQLKVQKRFAFDTETDALGAMQSNMIGMSFSWRSGTGFYLPVKGPSGAAVLDRDRVLKRLAPILTDPNVEKVGHNLKYDLMVMRQAGIEMRGVVLDSMIAAFLVDASRMQYGIDRLALELLNFRKIATVELIGKGKSQLSMDRVELERVAAYASEDADIALRLCDRLGEQLDEAPALRKLADDIETPLIDVLVEMETNGIAIDPTVLKAQSAEFAERIETLRVRIFESAGTEFNPDSPKQLGEVLFNRLKLKSVKKTKTGLSTDIEVLEKLAAEHAVPKLVLEYRSLVKLKNTYLDNLTNFVNPRTGRIHASFNQVGAATGRLSCSDPNLQNIPIRSDEGARIRSAFVPGDRANNVLVTADYSQIELRVLAHLAGEPALLEAFDRDEDIHATVASQVFNVGLEKVTRDQRAQAKIINFGIVYGVSAGGLARRIDNLTMQGAIELINAYHKRFPSIKRFLERCVMEAQSKGFVQTILGRRRAIAEINSRIVSVRNAAERIAINSVVQGSAADLIKLAMVNIHRRLNTENRPSKMLLQVHDELVFETPRKLVEAEAKMIREEMTGAMKLKVPLKIEIGWAKNWQEVK
ncbi:MAG: DNA polymerase I, partial [Tepidisphaeraceae bacterium]